RSHVTLMARDPHWLFAYWECAAMRATLSVYRVDPFTGDFVPIAARDVGGVGSHYVEAPHSGEEYVAVIADDLGNAWRSRPVRTPPGRVSNRLDGDWMTIEEVFHWEDDQIGDASSP